MFVLWSSKSFDWAEGYEYESINIEDDNNIDILLEKNKYARTMPQIFINDKLIGGYTDLVKYFEE